MRIIDQGEYEVSFRLSWLQMKSFKQFAKLQTVLLMPCRLYDNAEMIVFI